MVDAIITILLIGMNNCLCITISSKAMSSLLEFFLKLTIIIDFPIEDDENTLIFVENGLMTVSQVDNGEAAHTQCDSLPYPGPLIIWPTVTDDLAHSVYELLRIVTAVLCVDKSSYSAH